MRRERLRGPYSDDVLAKHYASPHNHFGNADHRLRVGVTIQVAKAIGTVQSVADLACGDAAIASAVNAPHRFLGDFAAGYPIVGPIEETIHQIPAVDLFVCTETIEHLDDPDGVLKGIRGKATMLLLSTPVGCFHDPNPEHFWAWDREAVEQMLAEAGFAAQLYASVDFTAYGPEHYCFGIWVAR